MTCSKRPAKSLTVLLILSLLSTAGFAAPTEKTGGPKTPKPVDSPRPVRALALNANELLALTAASSALPKARLTQVVGSVDRYENDEFDWEIVGVFLVFGAAIGGAIAAVS